MKNKKKRVREIADYIKFVFPMLVLYILFFIFPLFQTIGYSFTDYNGINPRKEFTGLTNYVDVFQDKWFYNSMLFTFGIGFEHKNKKQKYIACNCILPICL